jgi:hypothetical protein
VPQLSDQTTLPARLESLVVADRASQPRARPAQTARKTPG